MLSKAFNDKIYQTFDWYLKGNEGSAIAQKYLKLDSAEL